MEISKSAFKSLQITLPHKDLINSFLEIIIPLYNKIRFNEKAINQLNSLRDALLPKLMSGEVRVKMD